MIHRALLFGSVLGPIMVFAQAIDTVLLNELSFVHHPFVYSTFASLIDRTDAPYLYTANVEYGLRIYDISDPVDPQEVVALWPPSFGGLKPTNLHQDGPLLYVSLGGYQGATQHAGLAILDVTDPEAPVMLDQWDSAAFSTGCAIVRVQNGYAYLGAMEQGLVILDVQEPSDISFVSSFLPDVAWPGIVDYPPNARGIALRGDTLFLGFDAGCLRAIDITDRSAPVEIGHYVNPQQPANTAVAYNNATLVGDRLYVATDFCGFEVIDVSDPANMEQTAWVNPWNCNGLSWFGSDGHTNELITAMHDSLLFVSGADSEVLVYDITAPSSPVLVGGFIHPNDSSIAWGLDVRGDLLSVNYIDNSLVLFPPQPYYADDGGVQLFNWYAELSMSLAFDAQPVRSLIVSPNPADGPVRILRDNADPVEMTVMDAMGRVHLRTAFNAREHVLDLSALAPGCYLVELRGRQLSSSRVVIR